MPGPTDTPIWERGDMEDTAIAKMAHADAADVAKAGIEAMLAGDDHVVPGLLNRASMAASNVLPDTTMARSQAALTKPGSAS
jgi:uncharacterized protein